MSYERHAAVAAERLRQYGAPMTVARSGGGAYNPDTNKYEGGGETVSGFALQSGFEQRNIDGTNVRFGDALFLAALDGEPRTNDTVSFGGRSYTVVSVEALSPDGAAAVYYKIQAR